MQTDRRQQLERIFAEAAELPSAARSAHLRQRCEGDETLHRELSALLASFDNAGEFLDTPALDLFAQQISREGWHARPGDAIGSYIVLERTGAGGMGEVWRARDDRIGRDVGIKLLLPHPANLAVRVAAFQREARAAGALNHPNVLTVYDVGEHRGTPYLVTEWLKGESLRARIASASLTTDAAVSIAVQLARGLAAAHAQGIVHRDLKPENVFLMEDERVKILDFGLATLRGDSIGNLPDPVLTGPALIGGTHGYMAPEQAGGGPVDDRADLFAFGMVLREMLGTKVSERLAAVIERCTAVSPDDRFVSAEAVAAELESIVRERHAPVPNVLKTLRRRSFLAWIGVILVLAGLAGWRVRLSISRSEWARTDAAAEISRRAGVGDFGSAFVLAREALAIAPDDPHLKQLWLDITVPWEVASEPAGAEVQIAVYRETSPVWLSVGTTPLPNVRLPRALIRVRLSKAGFEQAEGSAGPRVLTRRLDPIGASPRGMVRVVGGRDPVRFGTLGPIEDFWIDRFEVTNREFKEFVDSGGYANPVYWREPFIQGGRRIPWENAIRQFVDSAGRPGPATWTNGTYAPGQADHPVGGVSWYEAAAFAAFRGKSLPTMYHWYRAADLGRFSDILPMSNFDEKGPAPVGTYHGLGAFGTYDMAGNLKEWCLNDTGGRRFLLGGAWNEPRYMFSDFDARDPFERQSTHGFRLARYIHPPSGVAVASVSVHALKRTRDHERPVSDATFDIYRTHYAYDRTPLHVSVERIEELDLGTKQIVAFDTAYGERMRALVILPRHVRGPLQAVVFVPASDALRLRSTRDMTLAPAYDIVRSGRAFVYPIYRGTYERGAPEPGGPLAKLALLAAWSKDLGRTIDYLATRDDMDLTRLAFYGVSLGAGAGIVLTAIEPRFAASVLQGAGMHEEALAEIDPLNFAPRITVPTLMLNGRYDFETPYESAQRPLFERLGSREKRHVVLETGHALPADRVAREILPWLDHHLGIVRAQPR